MASNRVLLEDQEKLITHLIDIAQVTNAAVTFGKPGIECGVSYTYRHNKNKITSSQLDEIVVPFPSTPFRVLIFLHELGHIEDHNKKIIGRRIMDDYAKTISKSDFLLHMRYEIRAWKEALLLYDKFNLSYSPDAWRETMDKTLLSYYNDWLWQPPDQARSLVVDLFGKIEERCPGFIALMKKSQEELFSNGDNN